MTGSLSVASTPAGASVQIDGKANDAWVTPFSMEKVTPGRHQLTFSKDGFTSATRTVDVNAGRISGTSATLTALTTATLQLDSDPHGAAIDVDGKPNGQVTPAKLTVAPGKHTIELHLQGYHSLHLTADLKAGQTFPWTPALNPDQGRGIRGVFRSLLSQEIPAGKGVVTITSDPPGARVSVNNAPLRRATPVQRLPLAPGSYSISAQLPGYRTNSQQVTVEVGKAAQIDLKLQRQ